MAYFPNVTQRGRELQAGRSRAALIPEDIPWDPIRMPLEQRQRGLGRGGSVGASGIALTAGGGGFSPQPRSTLTSTAQTAFNQEMERARLLIEQERADLEAEVARGNLDIAGANIELQKYIADTNTKLGMFRAETERQVQKGTLDINKARLAVEKQLSMKKLGVEEKLGMGELGERKRAGLAEERLGERRLGVEAELGKGALAETRATREAQEAWRRKLYAGIRGLYGGGDGGTTNLGALEEQLYMPAQRSITEQMKAGLAGLPGEATGAGYGGRSSWEDRQRAGILTSGVRAIGDVRSQAGVQATRIRLEEAERARQSRGQMAAALAGLGG